MFVLGGEELHWLLFSYYFTTRLNLTPLQKSYKNIFEFAWVKKKKKKVIYASVILLMVFRRNISFPASYSLYVC